MERELKVKISKHNAIYGRYSGSSKRPLVIIVPGLGVDLNYSLYCNAAYWFARNGFATFRFDFYGWQKDARQLVDSTLRTQADDLDGIRHIKSILPAGSTVLMAEDISRLLAVTS